MRELFLCFVLYAQHVNLTCLIAGYFISYIYIFDSIVLNIIFRLYVNNVLSGVLAHTSEKRIFDRGMWMCEIRGKERERVKVRQGKPSEVSPLFSGYLVYPFSSAF